MTSDPNPIIFDYHLSKTYILLKMVVLILSNTVSAIARGLPRRFREVKLPNYPLFSLSSIYHHYLPPKVNCFNGIRSVSFKEGEIRSPDLVALEYADLNLPPICEEVGHVRIRQHVNPLTAAYCVPAEVPDWNVVYKDSSLPLMVDVGCGSGRFLLWLAQKNMDSQNYMGLEIRGKLVQRANIWVKGLGITNAHFVSANATVSFQQLVSSYPGPLAFVSVLCPDPYFKKRHSKRRVLQKPLVDSIVNSLSSGGQVFMQSDVLDVAVDMRNQFDSLPDLLHVDGVNSSFNCDNDGWLLSNPMGIRTEREIHAELEGAQIYRRLYQKSE